MRTYLLRLTACSLLAALLRRMAPAGGPGRAVRLGAGLLVLLTALTPLAQADPLAAAEHLGAAFSGDPLSTQTLTRETNRLLAERISDQAEAYILDKAAALGARVRAEVTTQPLEGVPVPYRVRISGPVPKADRQALTEIIVRDLNIPAERQEWSDMG